MGSSFIGTQIFFQVPRLCYIIFTYIYRAAILPSLIYQFRSKFEIRRVIADLKQCLQEAELLNVRHLVLKPENESYKILEWYDVVFSRDNDALDEALFF